jgi:hypothetical protein
VRQECIKEPLARRCYADVSSARIVPTKDSSAAVAEATSNAADGQFFRRPADAPSARATPIEHRRAGAVGIAADARPSPRLADARVEWLARWLAERFRNSPTALAKDRRAGGASAAGSAANGRSSRRLNDTRAKLAKSSHATVADPTPAPSLPRATTPPLRMSWAPLLTDCSRDGPRTAKPLPLLSPAPRP